MIKKGRGQALNWDLYGISKDFFNKKTLIVVQVRQYTIRYKNGWADIKKSYFLIGRNEDNTVFAHPVSSHAIHTAARSGKDVVRAVQNYIFNADYTKILRQGDIGLIPIHRIGKGFINNSEAVANTFTIEDSHLLESDEARILGSNVYVRNPSLYHIPKTHPDLEGLRGWFRVIIGKRSNFYRFAPPTID